MDYIVFFLVMRNVYLSSPLASANARTVFVEWHARVIILEQETVRTERTLECLFALCAAPRVDRRQELAQP